MLIPGHFVTTFVMFLQLFVPLFVAPRIGFEQTMYAANESEEVQAVLVLSGLLSIDIKVQVSTFDGSATGKHSFKSSAQQLQASMCPVSWNCVCP